MKKEIYLIRHSGPFVRLDYNFKSFSEQNERMVLSVEAEEKAKEISNSTELQNIDKVYSSNSVRAIATAKYIANKNDLNVIVDNDLNEIVLGINSVDDFPKNLYQMQFNDGDYKLANGESVNEVVTRADNILKKILVDDSNKKALVVHGIYVMCFLKQFCNVSYMNDIFTVVFKDKIVFEGILNNPPEIFKLIFDDNGLISIENIRPS